MAEHPESKHVLEYNQITDEIYIGTNMCCQVDFAKELLDKGITADISLEAERVDNPNGVDYFLWLPVLDHHAPTQNQLRLGVQTLEFFTREGIKLYAHCKHGHGRAPTLVVAYFIKQGMDVDEAIEFVKSKRSSIHLSEVQIEALREYEKKGQI